jgi:transposase
MTDDLSFLPLKVTKVGPTGKRTFDPDGKRRLIQTCRRPGVSISGMALKAGVNVNQLHKWIRDDERVDAMDDAAECVAPDRGAREAAVFRLDEGLKVYLHREPVDFRLNINGLALLVEQALGLDPFAPASTCSATAGATASRSWAGTATASGCCSSGWSRTASSGRRADVVPTLTVEQLHWLLEGIDIAVVQRHPQRIYERVG